MVLATKGKHLAIYNNLVLDKYNSLGDDDIGDVSGDKDLDKSNHVSLAKKGKHNFR